MALRDAMRYKISQTSEQQQQHLKDILAKKRKNRRPDYSEFDDTHWWEKKKR